METLDIVIWSGAVVLGIAFIYIFWSYQKNLKGSPRELYLLFFTKLTEYSAYGAMNLTFVLYLSADCGLSDTSAGTVIGVWSMFLTVGIMVIGPVCDAIGIKKTLLIGTIVLLGSRFFLPFTNSVALAFVLGFIPMGIGMAMMGPVLSVGIKRFTTKETAALGFGLFYTMMNVGWAIGAQLFDSIRGYFGEHEILTAPVINWEFSTYQIILALGFVFTVPDLIAILLMRDGVEMHDDGTVTVRPSITEQTGTFLQVLFKVSKKAALDTVNVFKSVAKTKEFWYFLLMMGSLVFVRFVFYHFHYTFPKYGIRVLGEGQNVGSIFGVLNPVMIVFLTPLIASLTKKFSSYKVMMVGTFISAFSIFIATMPETFYEPLMGSWFSELVMDRWLSVPPDLQRPLFLSLVIMVAVFTVGEAIWSPRLMQFMAEVAPKGKEGTYISLSYIPYFASKLIVGPLSGWLVSTYVPEGQESYPMHYMIWVWIGGMAVVSPLSLLILKGLFSGVKNNDEPEENTENASA